MGEELHRALFPVVYSNKFYQDLLSPDHVSILAFNANGLVGAATAVIEMGPEQKSGVGPGPCTKGQTTAYIMTLGVASCHRRRGLGRRLLKMIVEECNADRYTLHMKVGNHGALQMYLNFGFEVTEELPNHYNIDGKTYDALSLVYYPPTLAEGLVVSTLSWLGLAGCFKST